jgi:hypothetical protein
MISARSVHYLQQFSIWKQSGMGSLLLYDARTADAILMLEDLWREENKFVEIEK